MKCFWLVCVSLCLSAWDSGTLICLGIMFSLYKAQTSYLMKRTSSVNFTEKLRPIEL